MKVSAPRYPLAPVVKRELVSTVRMQRAQLKALLENPDRDQSNFHLTLAGVLRSMLCDAKWPTLLVLAKEVSAQLRVWAPLPRSALDEPAPRVSFHALVASALPVRFGHEVAAEDYLDSPIGVITTGEVESLSSRWYTPREVIKWAANKKGPSHFDPKGSASLDEIGSAIVVTGQVTMKIGSVGMPIGANDNVQLRMALLQIGQWAVVACDQVLASALSGANAPPER